jgi:hypothetical protein
VKSSRLWLVLGLAAAVAMVMLGYRVRVMAAGGRAILVLAIIGFLVWLALRRRGPSSPDLDKDGKHVP